MAPSAPFQTLLHAPLADVMQKLRPYIHDSVENRTVLRSTVLSRWHVFYIPISPHTIYQHDSITICLCTFHNPSCSLFSSLPVQWRTPASEQVLISDTKQLGKFATLFSQKTTQTSSSRRSMFMTSQFSCSCDVSCALIPVSLLDDGLCQYTHLGWLLNHLLVSYHVFVPGCSHRHINIDWQGRN